MSTDDMGIAPISGADLSKAHAMEGAKKTAAYNARAANAQEAFLEFFDENAFNPLVLQKKFKTLDERFQKSVAAEAPKDDGREVEEASKALDTADRYAKSNVELSTRGLLNLLAQIKPEMEDDEMLGLVLKSYPDPTNADDALDFLIKVAEDRKEIQEKLTLSREKFNSSFGREIKAGRNIALQAQEFSQKGLGSTTALRDLYRDITGNPREPIALFEELSNNFEYAQMKTVIEFFLRSLGADLKSKGPSIDLEELKRLLSEGRSLQAILGVYYFFEERLPIIRKRFADADIPFPQRLSFIILSKQLVRYIKERFPSSDKVIKLSAALGITDNSLAQVIIFTQYRDAMRHTAPRLFKSERHRQDLLMTILEALSDLEDQLEEGEGEEEGE